MRGQLNDVLTIFAIRFVYNDIESAIFDSFFQELGISAVQQGERTPGGYLSQEI